jgi:hypothetical protein
LVKKTWDTRWERYFRALKQLKVESAFHEYYRGWIWNFLKAIKPKRWKEAQKEEVELFLRELTDC